MYRAGCTALAPRAPGRGARRAPRPAPPATAALARRSARRRSARCGLACRAACARRRAMRRTPPSSTMRAARLRVLKNRARHSQTSTRQVSAASLKPARPPPRRGDALGAPRARVETAEPRAFARDPAAGAGGAAAAARWRADVVAATRSAPPEARLRPDRPCGCARIRARAGSPPAWPDLPAEIRHEAPASGRGFACLRPSWRATARRAARASSTGAARPATARRPAQAQRLRGRGGMGQEREPVDRRAPARRGELRRRPRRSLAPPSSAARADRARRRRSARRSAFRTRRSCWLSARSCSSAWRRSSTPNCSTS